MRFSPKQAEFVRDSWSEVNLAVGSVGSGKTVATTTRFDQYRAQNLSHTSADVAIIGHTRDSIMRNVVHPLLVPFYGDALRVRQTQSELEFPDGRKCWMLGGQDAASQDKIRGLTLACILADETATLDPEFFAMALTRLRVPGARMFASTNCEGPAHWLKVKYIDNAEKLDWKIFNFRPEDNPFVPEAKKRAREAELKAAGEATYRKLWLAEWVASEGAVYDIRDEMFAELPKDAEVVRTVVGADFGASHKTAFIRLDITRDKMVYVTDELILNEGDQNLSTGEIVEEFIRKFRGPTGRFPDIYGDPSASPYLIEFEKHHLFPFYLGKQPTRRVINGIEWVKRLLNTGQMKISRRCRTLDKELRSYRWDENWAEKGEERPVKENDDSVDALRYGVMGSWGFWQRPNVTLERLRGGF